MPVRAKGTVGCRRFARLGLALLAFQAFPFARGQTPPATHSLAPPSDSANASAPVALPVDASPAATVPNVYPVQNMDAPPATPSAPLVVTTPAAARFDSAMLLFNGGQYAEALTAFSGFLRDFPSDRRREEVFYRLGESYRNLGRTEDALAAYTFQVKAYPDGPFRLNAEMRRGAIYFAQGQPADAIVSLRLVADKGEGELQEAGRYLLGLALLAAKKESDGRTLLQGLIEAQPPGKLAGSAAQALAELDDTQNHPVAALAYWQKAQALATDPAIQATAAARGGWSAVAANQWGEAESLFQTARQLDASGSARKVANTGLLRIFFQQKRFNEWLALYTPERDAVLDNARSEILFDLGHVQFSLQHWAEAVAAFDAYLKNYADEKVAVTAAYERFLARVQLSRSSTVAEAAAYLKAWPDSPYHARVQLLEAQELSRQKKFAEALPLWTNLAAETDDSSLPRHEILLELARSYDQLANWPQAATAYQAYVDEQTTHPNKDPEIQLRRLVAAQARLAVCLQNADQLLAATDAWKAVQAQAPEGSTEQEMALESLGLIYARGGPAQADLAVATFRTLLDKYPKSPLHALAAFSVGDALFNRHDYAGAAPLLLQARAEDAKTWLQPATQRLVLAAFGLKDDAKTIVYLKEYDALPAPADPQAQVAARLPAALFYWLAETARQAGRWAEAEVFYARVTRHPDPGDLLAGAWWELGEMQGKQSQWAVAVASYGNYRQLKPSAKDATVVLLALGRAELGAGDAVAAKALANQALLQEPEGPNSASARLLLGDVAMATKNYAEAARLFATLALLFDDPQITPVAMEKASTAFAKAGDATSAAEWRQKLKTKYPQ